MKGVKDVKSANGLIVGFIGLGNMGRPMASNLVRKGATVRVCDLNTDAVGALTALGATAGRVAEVAAASDMIFTMLPTTAEMTQKTAVITTITSEAPMINPTLSP